MLFQYFFKVFPTAICLVVTSCALSNSTTTVPVAGSQSPSPQVVQNASDSKTDVVRIGYVRWGLLPVIRQRGTLERALAAKNIKVEWVGPFPAFAPVLEAINAGSVDLAAGGDIPAISGLAGGTPICLLAYRPAVPQAEAILVQANSPIQKPADLVGKKVAVNRGGWGEHLLLKVIEKEDIPREQVKRVYMTPTNALPALLQSHVDAWAMWDPGLAMPPRGLAS